jgi:tRNA threonylcarbamoyladenosine biosynthesis protein TsaE
MNPFIFDAPDEAATDRLGAALAAALPAGTTVALSGTLGAGKTRLVQAIAAACGVPREEVVSPTFVLLQQYRGRRTINHLDAYRIRDEDEFRELGGLELLAGEELTIIEWAERVERALPDELVRIDIEVTGENSRRFTIVPLGQQYAGLVPALAAAIQA